MLLFTSNEFQWSRLTGFRVEKNGKILLKMRKKERKKCEESDA